MKFNRSGLKKLMIFLAILTPICFALRLYTYLNEFNANTGFFHGKSFGCTLFNIFALLVFFLCLLLSFSKKGDGLKTKEARIEFSGSPEDDLLVQARNLELSETKTSKYTGFEKTVRSFAGTLSAFATLFLSLSFFSFAITLLLTEGTLKDYYEIALLAFSVLGGLFFLLFAFKNSPKANNGMALFALTPVLWCALRLLTEYRDLTRFMNKSLYVGQFLFVIATLIFFVYQAQLILNDKALLKPNSYGFNLLSVLFFGLTARVPVLVAVLTEKITLNLIDSSSLLIDLAITLYAAVKLKGIFKNS